MDMHKTLHELAQQQGLDPRQTHALWRLAGMYEPPAALYQRLRHALALVAALLLGAGLIFWVAANWDAQTRTFKLHLLQATVAVPLAAALLLPAGRKALRVALVLLGTLALGGLLAYIGITYQTGADAWQLFATWAALALPMVLVLRSDWLWTLWLLIVAVAIGSWSGQSLMNHIANALDWRSSRNLITPVLWLLVFAAPLLIERLGLARNMQGQAAKPVLSLRLVALLAVGAWAAHGLFYVFDEWNWGAQGLASWLPPGFIYNTAFVLFAAWVGWRSRWRDLVVLAAALLALDVLALALLGKWMFVQMRAYLDGLLIFALIAAGVVGMSGRWLYQQQKAARADAETWNATGEKEGADHGN